MVSDIGVICVRQQYPTPHIVIDSVIIGYTVNISHWMTTVTVLVHNSVVIETNLGIAVAGVEREQHDCRKDDC